MSNMCFMKKKHGAGRSCGCVRKFRPLTGKLLLRLRNEDLFPCPDLSPQVWHLAL